MVLYSVLPVILASICLTVAFHEFLTWLRLKGSAWDLAFALMCVAATAYDIACAGDYAVDDSARSAVWLRAQAVALNAAAFSLVWYLSGRTGMVSKWQLYLVLGWCCAGIAFQLLGLGDLTWIVSKPVEMHVELPFGLGVVYREVESGPITNVQYYSGFLVFVYICWVIARFSRAGNRAEAAYLFAMVAVFFAAFVNDLAVSSRLYAFPFMLEYAWLGAVAFIGRQRASQLLAAAEARRDLLVSEGKLRTFIEQSSEAIVMTDEQGTVVEYNPAAELLSGMPRAEVVGIPLWQLAVRTCAAESPAEMEILEESYREILRSVNGQVPGRRLEGRLRRPDGSIRDYRQNLFPVRTASGVRIGSISYDITETRRAQQEILASLQEKSVLLKEIHHRVKNNLQVVSSLLYLHESRVADPRQKAVLRDCRNQILSMALIHEDLYRSEDLRNVDFGSYVRSLVMHLLDLFAPGISFVPPSESISLTIDQAIPCALIVNELCTNALKYAFPPESGYRELRVELHREEEDRVSLGIADNGVGLPEDVDLASGDSLGLRIVAKLVDQLHGSMRLVRGEGTRIEIDFPLARDEPSASGAAARSEPKGSPDGSP